MAGRKSGTGGDAGAGAMSGLGPKERARLRAAAGQQVFALGRSAGARASDKVARKSAAVGGLDPHNPAKWHDEVVEGAYPPEPALPDPKRRRVEPEGELVLPGGREVGPGHCGHCGKEGHTQTYCDQGPAAELSKWCASRVCIAGGIPGTSDPESRDRAIGSTTGRRGVSAPRGGRVGDDDHLLCGRCKEWAHKVCAGFADGLTCLDARLCYAGGFQDHQEFRCPACQAAEVAGGLAAAAAE